MTNPPFDDSSPSSLNTKQVEPSDTTTDTTTTDSTGKTTDTTTDSTGNEPSKPRRFIAKSAALMTKHQRWTAGFAFLGVAAMGFVAGLVTEKNPAAFASSLLLFGGASIQVILATSEGSHLRRRAKRTYDTANLTGWALVWTGTIFALGAVWGSGALVDPPTCTAIGLPDNAFITLEVDGRSVPCGSKPPE